MRVIARIPDASLERTGAATLAARTMPGPRRSGVGIRPRIDVTWPVAVLAVIAVLTWMLASWNDDVRLRRQRGEVRLAREPAASAPSPATTGGGAVVR